MGQKSIAGCTETLSPQIKSKPAVAFDQAKAGSKVLLRSD
jgi:hypothetical protein